MAPACDLCGEHFNPHNKYHGGPGNPERHVGDFGNVDADENGNASGFLEDDYCKLFGDDSVIGRSVMVHADEDDLGITGDEESKTTGYSGARLACGEIQITEACPRAGKGL